MNMLRQTCSSSGKHILAMQFSLCTLRLGSGAQLVLWCVHITRARAGVPQVCARRETRLAFIYVRKSSSTLLQLLARFRRVRIRIFTRSVYRL
jgi:hypothetical protein